MTDFPFIIAVDGIASSGKGTLANNLAKHFGFEHLDTGKLYRKLAFLVKEHGLAYDAVEQIVQIARSDEFQELISKEVGSLHTDEISILAAKISAFQEIRQELDVLQKDFPVGKKGVVIDGRDIGTVIFPEAQVKLFVIADAEVRAERRYKQLQNEGKSVVFTSVLNDLVERDKRDISRSVSPTLPAEDAIIIDTTALTPDSVLSLAITLTEGYMRYLDMRKAV